jgi:hypothetical protein
MSERDIRGFPHVAPLMRATYSLPYFVSGQPLSAAVGKALSPGTVAIIL